MTAPERHPTPRVVPHPPALTPAHAFRDLHLALPISSHHLFFLRTAALLPAPSSHTMDARSMTGGPIPTLVHVDVSQRAFVQQGIHNRWHPDIPAHATVKPGTVFKMETHEWTGGQIKNNDDADDIRNVDLTQIHYLSGPIAVEGVQPGDLLVVDILDVRPRDEAPWGFTGVFEKSNGGGLFATEFDSHAAKVRVPALLPTLSSPSVPRSGTYTSRVRTRARARARTRTRIPSNNTTAHHTSLFPWLSPPM